MLDAKRVVSALCENGILFASGVPDSLLSSFCRELLKSKNIINVTAANEGNSVALACGYNLATGKIPLVYMQNSGLGNALNPMLSLSDKDVYNIPCLYFIGYRGEPEANDEPQHITQGRLTEPLLETLGIKYEIICPDTELPHFCDVLKTAVDYMNKTGEPFAFLVKKGSIADSPNYEKASSPLKLTRRDAICAVAAALPENSVIVSTTGKTSRELYEIRNERDEGHFKDFLTVGSMGHASQIALSLSVFKKGAVVCCIDGEGALLMHMGAMVVNGALGKNNFIHVVINNGAHDSVGGQPNFGNDMDFSKLANCCGYNNCYKAKEAHEITEAISAPRDGAMFLQIDVRPGSYENLSRPKESPIQNKKLFMEYLDKTFG